jgi:hypothetical protein
MRVFWYIAPCSVAVVDRHFRGACCLHHRGDERNIGQHQQDRMALYPRGSHLHTDRCENLKSHILRCGEYLTIALEEESSEK